MTIQRHKTPVINIGGVSLGGNHPVVVQAMTDTDTADVNKTVEQTLLLAKAGAELVRITVNTPKAATAVAYIREQLDKKSCNVPLIGDFHYNGHKLLTNEPACAKALAKYRINPGNVGKGDKRAKQFAQIIEIAIANQKPVRIGGNWGSLDQDLLTKHMDANAKRKNPLDADQVMVNALVDSCLSSAKDALKLGMQENQIVLSAKVSRVDLVIDAYKKLAQKSNFALHVGLTEAGMGSQGIVASTAALSALLRKGIGDTIRVSLTPKPNDKRDEEVKICWQILQTLGLRHHTPSVTACPGCGRTTSTLFRELATEVEHHLEEKMTAWRKQNPEIAQLKVAVMGCVVNGPGESRHADIGISLPGSGENPVAIVYADGEKIASLKGKGHDVAKKFIDLVEKYVTHRFF